jgi:hypothetical protein
VPGAELLGDEWGNVRFSIAHRFMRECEAADQEHRGQVPPAQLEQLVRK